MRNIAQDCAICQEKSWFALDKDSLTARLRVERGDSCDAKYENGARRAPTAQISKAQKEFSYQSFMRGAKIGYALRCERMNHAARNLVPVSRVLA